MVKAGKYKEAIEIIMKDMPLPGILGRVCVRFCEDQCRRLEVDEPVSIKELKRFASDQVDILSLPVPEITPKEDKVAIIGSGPSGLAAAYFLALDGYRSTIFEALDVAGGMLAVGIPEFRLPREVLNKEIENIKRFGVEIKTNSPIGKDKTIDDLLNKEGFKAVYIATGAHEGMKLNIPGEDDYNNFYQCAPWLREVNLGNIKEIKGKVIVLGGGNAAIDAARVSVRLGADEVHIVYRRTRNEMPADPFEIEEAIAEDIKLHILITPKAVIGEDKTLKGLECLKNTLGDPDSSGRRRPVPIKGSEFFIASDHIIAAIGQTLDKSFATNLKDIEFSDYDLLTVNPDTLETKKKGVFAGGDVVTGPKTVIEAIAHGKQAASSISAYLQGKEIPLSSQQDSAKDIEKIYKDIDPKEPKIARAKVPTLEVNKRIKNFKESNLSMDEETTKREAARCLDCGVCCECFQCVEACKAEAINHDMADRWLDINVGSIILAPGFQPYDPALNDTYQYGRFPNVITALEFERILSASGPYEGHLIRPSDKKEPKKIAWLQCIGSRDVHDGAHPYCSAVCCTYAIKEAIVAKDHSKDDLDTAIFYIDMRTYGKDFEKYYNRAKGEVGVRFIKSKIANITKVDGSENLLISYTDEEVRRIEEKFDMVVLSVGLSVPRESVDLAQKIGIDLDSYNFVETDSFSPVQTSKPGIFVSGCFHSPKDIPSSVMDASANAAQAGALLSDSRFSLTKERQLPQEIDVIGDRPRIGVFVCKCGINIAGVVDVPAVATYAKSLPFVEHVDENLFSCSQDTQENITKVIEEHKLNRVVVASCTPQTHEPLFQETVRDAGINKYLFEMANIRNQCSWVHADAPQDATEKAKDLLRMATTKVALLEPLPEAELEINQAALVIGGGIAGMAAAQNLSAQGYRTYLIEKTDRLGGNALNLFKSWKGEDIQENLKDLIDAIQSDERIETFLSAQIKEVDGFVGNFTTTIAVDGEESKLTHGVTIIATGAGELKPEEYLYGKDPRVVSALELDRLFIEKDRRLKDLTTCVFVQCVGSRTQERPYCSRVCCTHSVVSALTLKEINPDMGVFILHRDMRTYGLRENLYKEARSKGVIFIRYDLEEKPEVEKDNGKIKVSVHDPALGAALEINPDLMVLAGAMIPEGTQEMARLFKVPLNQDEFFMEAHVKLRPVDFATDGVFLCGLAHSPKSIDESVTQAQAAASRAVTLLAQKTIYSSGVVAVVDTVYCSSCGVCVAICPYKASEINEKTGTAEINPVLCKGCGLCVASCRSGAIHLNGFDEAQIMAMIG